MKNRKSEMLRMRENGKTLDIIGVYFGVSRERVRQIIGSGTKRGSNPLKKAVMKLATSISPDKTNAEFVAEFGKEPRWDGARHKITGGSPAAVGYMGEQIVSNKLNELGIPHKLTNSRPFDIILENGRTIDVKYRRSGRRLPSGNEFYFWDFSDVKNKGGINYIVCVIKKTFYIIPTEDIPDHGGVGFVYPKSSNWGKQSKWHEYENRFDLLTD